MSEHIEPLGRGKVPPVDPLAALGPRARRKVERKQRPRKLSPRALVELHTAGPDLSLTTVVKIAPEFGSPAVMRRMFARGLAPFPSHGTPDRPRVATADLAKYLGHDLTEEWP